MQMLLKFIPLLARKSSYIIALLALATYLCFNAYTYKSLKKENEALIRQV